MDQKLLALRKEEAQEKQKQDKLLEISQKIYTLQKLIHDNEVHINHKEKDLETLKSQCNSLNIQLELQTSKIQFLKNIYKKQTVILEVEKCVLEKLHQKVWAPVEEFITNTENPVTNTEVEIQTFLKVRKMQNDMQGLKQANLKLEGAINGLELYKKLQEKEIKKLKQVMVVLEQANVIENK